MKKILVALLLIHLSFFAFSQKGFAFKEDKDKKQVNIFFNNKLLTAYCYYDSSRKPFLFPVNTVDGITVTRGYPFAPVAGERTDHPHHTGIWLNYESVNGLDFWNNSTAIPVEKRSQYGTITHEKIVERIAGQQNASLTVTAEWRAPGGRVLLHEKTLYKFSVDQNTFIIDCITKLVAADTVVVFKDVKDGMFAIRVARELEMPSREATNFVDNKGNATEVKSMGNNDVTGMYYSSEGLTGDSVWSSKGPWTMLRGKKQNKDITIAIIDHPSNPGYPAYWHARGYGLFAINPLGRKIFSKGAEELNFSLKPNASTIFRYRVLIHSGTLSKIDMDQAAGKFALSK